MVIHYPELEIPLIQGGMGVILIKGTRVPLDTVIYAYKKGESPEQIVDSFSTLQLADVYLIIAYYLRHKDEIENYLYEHKLVREAVRREVEARFPSHVIRERLLARRNQVILTKNEP